MKQTHLIEKPLEVMIEITPECNFSCSGCFNKATFANTTRNHKRMSTQYVKEILDSCASARIERVRFTGGEPLLRTDLVELIQYAYNKGLKVWLNTNATLITKDFLDKTEHHIDDVLISMNGFDSESDFRWTKTPHSFENKLRGVRLLQQCKISYIRAGTVATPFNIKHLEKIYALIKKMQFKNWELYRPIPISSKTNPSLDVSTLLRKLKRMSLDFGKTIKIANIIPFCADSSLELKEYSYGGVYDEGHSKLHVDPRGFAKPSYFINFNLGDPREIMSCWNHSFMKKMRQLKFLPEDCVRCSYRTICKGGSRYISELFTGEINNLDVLAHPSFVTRKQKNKIQISVIIPTYNNSLKLSYVLKALQFQAISSDSFEVIVVDDGSTDNTKKIVFDLKKDLAFSVRYVKTGDETFRAGQARNIGAKYAMGSILIFINDDIIPLPSLLEEYKKQLNHCDVCCGYTSAYGMKNKKDLYDNSIIYSAIDTGKNFLKKIPLHSEFRSEKFELFSKGMLNANTVWQYFTATNFAIKKDVFLRNPFNDQFLGWGVEDEEFAYRITKQNKLLLCKTAIVLHLTHDDEQIIELYTKNKVLSMLNNFLLFYKLYPVDEVKNYIFERYDHLPEKFKTQKIRKKLKTKLML